MIKCKYDVILSDGRVAPFSNKSLKPSKDKTFVKLCGLQYYVFFFN